MRYLRQAFLVIPWVVLLSFATTAFATILDPISCRVLLLDQTQRNDDPSWTRFQAELRKSEMDLASTFASSSGVDLSSAQVKIAFGKFSPEAHPKNYLTTDEIWALITEPGANDQSSWAFSLRQSRFSRFGAQSSEGELVPRRARFAFRQWTRMNASPLKSAAEANYWWGFKKQISYSIISTLNFISPISLMKPSSFRVKYELFAQLEKKPDLVPSQTDWQELVSSGSADLFLSRQDFLKRHPNAPRFVGRPIAWIKASLRKTVGFFSLLLAAFALRNKKDIAITEPIDSDQIQILNESFPLPHLAIRIQDRVYSYGVDAMNVSPIDVYMREKEIRAKQSDSGWFTRLSAKRAAIQVVTLRLPKNEVDQLRIYLSLQEFKHYQNATLVNDCSSMIADALREFTSIKVPVLIDPSPALTMQAIIAQAVLEDRSVDYHLAYPEPVGDRRFGFVFQSWYLNLKDLILFRKFFVFNQLNRMGLVIGSQAFSSGQLQEHVPATLEAFGNLGDDVARDFDEDSELNYYLSRKQKVPSALSEQDRIDAKEYFFENYQQINQVLMSSNLDLVQLSRAFYQATILLEFENTILGTQSFDLDSWFDHPTLQKEFDDFSSHLESL